jgi:hypothetical protein
VLPHAGKLCQVVFVAKAKLLLAQAALALSHTDKDLETVLDILNDVLVLAKKAQSADGALEVYYMQARIFHELGRDADRDAASKHAMRILTKSHLKEQMRTEQNEVMFSTSLESITAEMQALDATVL